MPVTRRDLQIQQQARATRFEPSRQILRGYLVEVNGSVTGARDDLVWVQAIESGNGYPFEAYNPGIVSDPRAGLFVLVERDPRQPARWALIQFNKQIYFDDQATYDQLPSPEVEPHSATHEFTPGRPGADFINVYPRAIVDFAVRPTAPASMKVRVYSGWYPGATNYERFVGPVNTKDFTADIPGTAGQALVVAISIDSSGTLNYTNGTAYVDGLPIPAASYPTVGTDEMIISAIRLVNGMTVITEENFDVEIRPLMSPGGLAGAVDRARVSKLVSPDLSIDPVLSADNSGDVTLAGTGSLTIPEYLYHAGDTDTFTRFQTNQWGLTVGNVAMVNAQETTQDIFEVNPGNADVDTRIGASGQPNALFVQGSSGLIGVKREPTLYNLEVTSNIGIVADGASAAHYIRSYRASPFLGIGLFVSARGSEATPAAVNSGDILGRFGAQGYHSGGGYSGEVAYFGFVTEENFTAGANGTGIDFQTTAVGGTSRTSKMKLTANGDLGIGVTPSYKLDVAGQAHATSFPTSSDRRLKKNLKPLSIVLDKIDNITPVSFNWNDIHAREMKRSDPYRREIGLIAQEVEKEFPELITRWEYKKQQFLAVDYGRMTAVLLQAIKELKARVEQLEAI